LKLSLRKPCVQNGTVDGRRASFLTFPDARPQASIVSVASGKRDQRRARTIGSGMRFTRWASQARAEVDACAISVRRSGSMVVRQFALTTEYTEFTEQE
jgi:hypothetical protein